MTDVAAFTLGWGVTAPALVVTASALLAMIADLFLRDPDRDALVLLGILGLASAAVLPAESLTTVTSSPPRTWSRESLPTVIVRSSESGRFSATSRSPAP